MKPEHYDLLDVELKSWLGAYFWGRALDIAPSDDRQFRVFADYVTDIAVSVRALGWTVAAVMEAVLDPRTEQAALEVAKGAPTRPAGLQRAVPSGAARARSTAQFMRPGGAAFYGPWFPARYRGGCDDCGGEIAAGDMIRANGKGGWLCEVCGDNR